jgi:hypothetical protein
MKKLIKITMLTIFLFGGVNSFSQTIGVKAGLYSSTMHIKYNASVNDNPQINPGFQIGPTIEIPINDIFSFESGLFFFYERS